VRVERTVTLHFFMASGVATVANLANIIYTMARRSATAFSTTGVMPLTARAKLLMMLESSISLVTILVVAGRAINIFGN
jgi:hypothetical protein